MNDPTLSLAPRSRKSLFLLPEKSRARTELRTDFPVSNSEIFLRSWGASGMVLHINSDTVGAPKWNWWSISVTIFCCSQVCGIMVFNCWHVYSRQTHIGRRKLWVRQRTSSKGSQPEQVFYNSSNFLLVIFSARIPVPISCSMDCEWKFHALESRNKTKITWFWAGKFGPLNCTVHFECGC